MGIGIKIKLEPVESNHVLQISSVQSEIQKDYDNEDIGAYTVSNFNYDELNKIKIEPDVDFMLQLPQNNENRKQIDILENGIRRSKRNKSEVESSFKIEIGKIEKIRASVPNLNSSKLRNAKIDLKKENNLDSKNCQKITNFFKKSIDILEVNSKEKSSTSKLCHRSSRSSEYLKSHSNNSTSSKKSAPTTKCDANKKELNIESQNQQKNIPQSDIKSQYSEYLPKILKISKIIQEGDQSSNSQEQEIPKNNHELSTNKSNKFQCKQCFKITSSKIKLYQHQIIHRPKVECQICHRKIQAYLFRRHMKHHVPDMKRFKCDLCGSGFVSIVGLRGHMYKHMSIKRFYCDICGRGYNDSRHLREHKLSHINPMAYKCDLCPKGYERKEALKAHLHSIHMKSSKTYECKVCGYKTKVLSVMYSHQKRHDKQVPCVDCGKMFSHKTELQDHVSAVHVNIKNVKCDLCEKMFASKRYMMKHIRRTHGDPNKFKCEHCESTFKCIDGLKQHMRKHNSKIVVCEFCKRLVRDANVKKHQAISLACQKKQKEALKKIKLE